MADTGELWVDPNIDQLNNEKGVKKGLLDGIEQGMPKGDSWIVRLHHPQNLKFLMFLWETSSEFLCFLETFSCRPVFTFMRSNDESTYFFDGSNLKFEDSRGRTWSVDLSKTLIYLNFDRSRKLKMKHYHKNQVQIDRGSVIWQTFHLIGKNNLFCCAILQLFHKSSVSEGIHLTT